MKPKAPITALLSACVALPAFLSAGVALAAPPPASQAPAAQAPAPAKTPIFLSHSGQDAVGVSLANSIREALRRAPSVSLAPAVDDAEIVLLVSTMNPDPAQPNTVTTAGWTLLLMKEATKAYIGGGLRMADPGSLQKSATELVTHIEGVLKARAAEIPSSPEFEKVEAAWNEAVEGAARKLPDELFGVKVKAAFIEQMQTYFKWTTAASLVPDVQQAITAGMSYFTGEGDLAKKIQAQAARLSQCEAELAALKKSIKK